MVHRKTSKRSKAKTILRLADLEQSRNALLTPVRIVLPPALTRLLNVQPIIPVLVSEPTK